MNNKALAAFRAFVETGSISKAANRLFRTPPQISRLLAALEEDAGFQIFFKQGRNLALTDDGWRFYEQVDRALTAQDELDRFAGQLRRGQRDRIRILSAPFISHALINRALAKLAKKYPNLTAVVESRVRLDIDSWVADEMFDIAVTLLPVKSKVFDVVPFHSENIFVAMNSDHPLARIKEVTFDDFVQHEIVATHPRSILTQHLLELSRRSGKPLNIRFEAKNGVIACQLAGQGLGCCLADPFVARSSGVTDLVLRRFASDFKLEYCFLFPSWAEPSQVVRELEEEIRVIARETSHRLTS